MNTAGVPFSRVASRATASAPALRNNATGGRGAQQWTITGWLVADLAASITAASTSRASGSATAGTVLSPDGVDSAPASTAGSDGSSSCTTTSAPVRLLTSADVAGQALRQ